MALSRLATGGGGNVLTMVSGVPTWQTPASNVTVVSVTPPLTVTTPNTTPAIAITQATSATDGYLKAGDWNTFNGKLDNKLIATGDLIYQSAIGPSNIPIGANGQVLTVSAGLPTWSLPSVTGTSDSSYN